MSEFIDPDRAASISLLRPLQLLKQANGRWPFRCAMIAQIETTSMTTPITPTMTSMERLPKFSRAGVYAGLSCDFGAVVADGTSVCEYEVGGAPTCGSNKS